MAPGAGFKEFFPTAPGSSRDKLHDRDRLRRDSSASRHGSSSKRDSARPDASRSTPADDSESLPGDMPVGVGSASSHESASSSIFSTHNSAPPLNASTSLSASKHSSLTPLTNVGSPSHISAPSHATKHHASSSRLQGSATPSAKAQPSGHSHRPPVRDPKRPNQGKKCIYDPLLDKSLSSSEKKTTKPKYKMIGSVRPLYLYYTCGEWGERRVCGCFAYGPNG